jgi:hypothetical protein
LTRRAAYWRCWEEQQEREKEMGGGGDNFAKFQSCKGSWLLELQSRERERERERAELQ